MEELKLKKEPHLDAFNGINIGSDTKQSGSVENENNKGMGFPSQEKELVPLFSSTASVQDLRSLYIEKERKICDEPSPRGVLEDILRSSESELEPSKASTSCSEDQAIPAIPSQWRDFFRSWRQKSMRRLLTFPPVGVSKISRRRSCRECPAPTPNHSPASAEGEFHFFKPAWKNFTLKELQLATDNFSSENIIGKGGYGEVFKGCLEDGQLVAVKRLTRGTQDDRTSDFLSELGIIVHISHPNAAKLIGFGVEGGMHLVLQLSPNGSLASLLNGSRDRLNWAVRYKIATGTAEGLRYLHENCQRRIIHRDIKAANILLTEDFAPQICDFGLAKWLPDQWTHHTMSSFEGTFGYMAPEYLMHGIVDEKTDVYAFGVLLLELITGRRALDPLQESLVIWAKPLLQKNDFRQLIDSSLGDAYNHQQLNRMVLTASLCVQQSPLLRPPMSQILQFLRGAEGNIASPKPCKRMGMQRTYSEEIFDAEEYNDTRYLKDLHRHREIAMDFSEQ